MPFCCFFEEEREFGFEIFGVLIVDECENFVDVPGGQNLVEVFIFVRLILFFEVVHNLFLKSKVYLFDDPIVLDEANQNVQVFFLFELYSLVYY